MRSVALLMLLAVAVAAASTGCGTTMTAGSTWQAEEARVLATEDEYVAAEVAGDEAVLRRLVDERFQFNTSRGATTGKEKFIQSVLKSGMVGQTIKERSVLIEGPIALVFGTAELRLAAPDKPESTSSLRYTATYVNRQGQWRMLALQMQQRAQP
jgi:hypothetical protein